MQSDHLIEEERDRWIDPVTGLFKPHNSARRLKKLRTEALMADIAEEFDGGLAALGPADRIILEKACVLLCGRPHSHWDQVRVVNSAGRLLGGLRKRLKPKPSQARRGPSMSDLLKGNGNG
jgi:hypothetical protein